MKGRISSVCGSEKKAGLALQDVTCVFNFEAFISGFKMKLWEDGGNMEMCGNYVTRGERWWLLV